MATSTKGMAPRCTVSRVAFVVVAANGASDFFEQIRFTPDCIGESHKVKKRYERKT